MWNQAALNSQRSVRPCLSLLGAGIEGQLSLSLLTCHYVRDIVSVLATFTAGVVNRADCMALNLTAE